MSLLHFVLFSASCVTQVTSNSAIAERLRCRVGLRGNFCCSSEAHWKAHSGLPISDTRTFSLAVMAKALRANIDWKSPFLKGMGHFGPEFQAKEDQPFVHG